MLINFKKTIARKLFENKEVKEDVFVVIIMSYFGDALVGNSLFQNIKKLFPKSKTVFIINNPYYEVAKYQRDVDEVFIFDKKNKHKGIVGLFKFVKEFPYKNIKCVFKICEKRRVDILSILLRPQKIINYKHTNQIPTHERYCNLLKKITSEKILKLPIRYDVKDDIPEKFQNIFSRNKKYIAICTTASSSQRDMPIQTGVDLIKKLKNNNYEILLVGIGERAKKYGEELKNNHCEFINLINKTSIYELAQCLKKCKSLISVDTGTMHLGYASMVPTVCLFYVKGNIIGWAPDKTLYPHTILPEDNTSDSIYNACMKIIEKSEKIDDDDLANAKRIQEK